MWRILIHVEIFTTLSGIFLAFIYKYILNFSIAFVLEVHAASSSPIHKKEG